MSEQSLHTKILDKIKDQKPYSSLRFRLISFFMVLLLTILVSISVLVTTFFIYDIIDAGRLRPNDWFNILIGGFFELLLLVVFLIALIYILYRRTDFVLVKDRLTLLTHIVAIIIGVSSAGLLAIDNVPQLKKVFDFVSQRVEDQGLHRNRSRRPRPGGIKGGDQNIIQILEPSSVSR
jgi:hypothetical protein